MLTSELPTTYTLDDVKRDIRTLLLASPEVHNPTRHPSAGSACSFERFEHEDGETFVAEHCIVGAFGVMHGATDLDNAGGVASVLRSVPDLAFDNAAIAWLTDLQMLADGRRCDFFGVTQFHVNEDEDVTPRPWGVVYAHLVNAGEL